MRYYRDLQPGETLQAGDMWRVANHSDAEWQTITADDIAEAPEGGLTVISVEESGIEYRRPVDAVPREEHERLRRALDACGRYFEHCERVSVSQHRSDSKQMYVRMALRNEAREAIEKLMEVQQ